MHRKKLYEIGEYEIKKVMVYKEVQKLEEKKVGDYLLNGWVWEKERKGRFWSSKGKMERQILTTKLNSKSYISCHNLQFFNKFLCVVCNMCVEKMARPIEAKKKKSKTKKEKRKEKGQQKK